MNLQTFLIYDADGKSLAVSFDCKYIETSSGMQHNVDELLVGILKQIRLKISNPEQARSLFRKRSSRKKRINSSRFLHFASSFNIRFNVFTKEFRNAPSNLTISIENQVKLVRLGTLKKCPLN